MSSFVALLMEQNETISYDGDRSTGFAKTATEIVA